MAEIYFDDPVEESTGKRRNFKGVLALIVLMIVGGSYIQTTLAANINLNSGSSVEFGQGVAATTACSGATNLTITPLSSFTNASGGGAHYFSSVKVANIPSECHGKDFTINAYGNSNASPLAIFNSTSTNAVVYNNAGTFQLGAGTAVGTIITSGSGTFTLTFTDPVATSGSVFKLTIQSGDHTVSGFDYNVGDIGPGGGRIFYKSVAGFNCGTNHSSTGSPNGGLCNVLEMAPSNWNGGSQALVPWATGTGSSGNAISDVTAITNDGSVYNNALGIGLGYKNSLAIIAQGNDVTTAVGKARGYAGGSKNDWYLPTSAELNLLCQWNRGVTQDVATVCSGGSLNSGTGAGTAGFVQYVYAASSENSASTYWYQNFDNGNQNYTDKTFAIYLRPIRAF